MSQQRTGILSDFRQRANGYWGPDGSEEAGLFRAVMGGPLQPLNKVRPLLYVLDMGQKREGPHDEGTDGRSLGVQMVLQLAEDWSKVESYEEWSDKVERIIHKYQNWLPSDRGVIRNDYVNDEPLTLQFFNGKSSAVWTIEFEVEYFTEVMLRDDWSD